MAYIQCAAADRDIDLYSPGGGIRVIYYWERVDGQIFLLFLYPKNEQSDLTRAEVGMLRTLMAG